MSNNNNISKTEDFCSDEYDDSFYDSDTESIDDTANIPDIETIELSKKETFYFKIIDKFYRQLTFKKIDMMIQIIEKKTKISLRLLDWFVTRYAHKNKISYELDKDDDKDNFDGKLDKKFNVHISYKAQLKSFKKRYFDPFRRRKKFKYYFDKDMKKILCTTLGQLNFFKWAFSNNVIEYVENNYNDISKAMVNSNREDKKRKLKEKKDREKEKIIEKEIDKKNSEDVNKKVVEELKIKKNGINITAKKKAKLNEVKIILSFD